MFLEGAPCAGPRANRDALTRLHPFGYFSGSTVARPPAHDWMHGPRFRCLLSLPFALELPCRIPPHLFWSRPSPKG
jgi:hypothetical protein